MWSSALVAFLHFLPLAIAKGPGVTGPRLVPRSRSLSLPIYQQSRDVGSDGAARSGLTPVTISSDRQSYFSVITVGEISFRVVLDTASSDLWIMSSDCTTSNCKSVPRYPLTYQSPTFVTVNGNSTPFMASYTDGTVASGFVAKESVQLSNLTITDQAFGIVTDSNISMIDETSGIMGLGFPRLSSIANSVTNSTPFFVALAQQGLLDYPLFGLSLTRNSSGTLSIGAIDSSVVTNASRIYWNSVAEFSPFGVENNVSSYLQWAIPMPSFSVNGTQITTTPTYPNITHNSSLALFDIGASGLYGPYQDVSRLYALIDGARIVDPDGQWAIPCETVVPISLTFGHQNYTLQPSDYIIGPATGNPNLCLSWPRALSPSSDGIDWQIGATFLRTVYSIYSYGINTKEPPMVGLYPLQNTTDASQSPDSVASFLSSISATVATTLPNFPLPTPTYTTPPYAFNASVSAAVGGIVKSGLATSTYSPILGQSLFNITALPTITPSPTLATFIITDSSGAVITTTSIHSMATIALGVPPGWNAGSTLHSPPLAASISCLLILWTLVYGTDIFSFM